MYIHTQVLDPLIENMQHFTDGIDLKNRIATMFSHIDEDGSGTYMYIHV